MPPEHAAFDAELVLTPKDGAMELARDRWPRDALCQQHGHHRNHHGRFALPQGTESGSLYRRLPAFGHLRMPGIRKWPEAYLPKIFERSRVDRAESVSQGEAEEMTRRLACEEGVFAGISSCDALAVALRLAAEVENAAIVTIVCDRYLSTGVSPA